VPRVYEGNLTAPRGSFGIVVSRYNASITRKLLQGALDALAENGVSDKNIDVAWVPGAFEIPVVADRMAKSGR
jgi:6,7-dimethyl-8-ribityllumazine synthase